MPYEQYSRTFPKRLSMIHHGHDFWVMSQFTGEVVKPYDICGIFRMISDMFRKW